MLEIEHPEFNVRKPLVIMFDIIFELIVQVYHP